MRDHLYPGVFQTLEACITGTNGRQIIQAMEPGEIAPADGCIRWALVPGPTTRSEAQSGRIQVDMVLSLEGAASVAQWSAECLGGLWEDIDDVADALDSFAGEAYADGGVLCSVIVDGWAPNWDGNSVTIIMDIQLRIERVIL